MTLKAKKMSKAEDEIWKDVPGYEGTYQVSSFGRIKSIPRTRMVNGGVKNYKELIRKPMVINKYLSLSAKSPGKKNKQLRVHRVVAQVFVPNPENKPHVNHKDCNKLNNHYLNLEWCTSLENNLHAIANGRWNAPKGQDHWQNKLDETQVRTIRKCLSEGITQQKIADHFKVHRTCISAIKLGYHWSHLQ